MPDEIEMMAHPLCRGAEFRLTSRENLPPDLAHAMVRGMVQFLQVLATHRITLSPPTLIDIAWHEALIDTVNYPHFCAEFFGTMLHHHPPIHEDDFRPENLDLTRKTVLLARETFGAHLETVVWRRGKRLQVLSETR